MYKKRGKDQEMNGERRKEGEKGWKKGGIKVYYVPVPIFLRASKHCIL